MPMYNLIKYSDYYLKTSRSLKQYYRDVPHHNITIMIMIIQTSADGNTKDVETAVPLKYLINFWRTLEMPLIIVKLVSI